MLRPATGAGANPRIGLSGDGVKASSGFAFDGDLSRRSCGWSAGTAALAFFGEAGAGADFVLLSEGEVCFCLSSASSVWMRCSIFSSFFIKASFASPSAAQALLQLMIDIAVAASNALRLEQ